jgi:hypothetical protein
VRAKKINKFQELPVRQANPGLRSDHFADFGENHGYYSWLFQLMFESTRTHCFHIGRFENVRTETMRLFEVTGTPITKGITAYLHGAEVLNSTHRPRNSYIGGYHPELGQLVAEKERYLLDQFDYVL